MAFGYVPRKSEVTVPRQSVTPQNYFYPRPESGPGFLQNRRPQPYSKVPIRGRDLEPAAAFEERTYYYSVPYVRVPLLERRPITEVEQSNARTITRDLLRNNIVTKVLEVRESKSLQNEIDAKETAKQENSIKEQDEDEYDPIGEYDSEEQVGPEVVEGLIDVLPGPSAEEIEDAYDNLSGESGEAQEEDADDFEENIPDTTLNPPLINDKFLHQEFLQKNSNSQSHTRSFNFSSNSFIKGISDKFSKIKGNASTTAAGADVDRRHDHGIENLSEKPLQDYDDDDDGQDDAYIEGIKAPWSGFAVAGPANQKDVLKGGGLIIQRLRVRNGSIAVAGEFCSFDKVRFYFIFKFRFLGPGGVATAGSGKKRLIKI